MTMQNLLQQCRKKSHSKVRRFWVVLAAVALLLVLAWIVGLVAPLFTVVGQEISGRDLILILGGLFLIPEMLLDYRRARPGKGC